MRIGELAALVGVSTRTVRHYHKLGVLPEPERLTNGYRDYRLRDAVLLARVRRLAELGLSLDEIRDVLAGDQQRDLRDVLAELDADLALEQERIGARRARLAALLADADLHPDATVSPEMAALLRELPQHDSPFARMDREFLALVDTGVDPEERAGFLKLMQPLATPAMAARGQALYARLDALSDADPADPRVADLAADFAAYLPDDLAAALVASLENPLDLGRPGRSGPRTAADNSSWLDAITTEMTAAQAAVFRRLVTVLREAT